MGLLSRLTTLAKADAHGMVDALEDKALVLRQQVREAGAELDRKRCRIEALEAEAKDLQTAAERHKQRMTTLEEDIELAIAGGKDELARYAIKKLLPLRHGMTGIEQHNNALADEKAELEARLAEQEAEFERLEQRVRGYLARHGIDGQGASAGTAGYADLVVTDEDVELELLRRRAAEPGAA